MKTQTAQQQADALGVSKRTLYRRRKRDPMPNGRPCRFDEKEFRRLWKLYDGDIKAITDATDAPRSTVSDTAKRIGLWATRKVRRNRFDNETESTKQQGER